MTNTDHTPGRPTLDELRNGVGSEQWLAALALLALSPVVAKDAAMFTEWAEFDGRFTYAEGQDGARSTFHPDPQMDWERWATSVDEEGRGWSSTEWRLFELAAALTVRGRKIAIVGILDRLNSCESDVLAILVQWASGGNNRDLRGRVTVEPGDD